MDVLIQKSGSKQRQLDPGVFNNSILEHNAKIVRLDNTSRRNAAEVCKKIGYIISSVCRHIRSNAWHPIVEDKIWWYHDVANPINDDAAKNYKIACTATLSFSIPLFNRKQQRINLMGREVPMQGYWETICSSNEGMSVHTRQHLLCKKGMIVSRISIEGKP